MDKITTVGLDLAKSIFQVHAVDASDGIVLVKRLRRGQVLAFFAKQPPCLVGMERPKPRLNEAKNREGGHKRHERKC